MRENKRNVNQENSKVKTFTVPFAIEEIKENITLNTKNQLKPTKKQIIHQAFKFHSQVNISEAARIYKHLINLGFIITKFFLIMELY